MSMDNYFGCMLAASYGCGGQECESDEKKCRDDEGLMGELCEGCKEKERVKGMVVRIEEVIG